MPVIKLSEENRKGRLLSGMIQARMDAKQITTKQMAAMLGIHPETFKRKKNHPEFFTYPELMKIFKKLEFPESEILEVM